MCKLCQYFVCDCVQAHFYISRWRGSQGSFAGLLLTVWLPVCSGVWVVVLLLLESIQGLLLLKEEMALLLLILSLSVLFGHSPACCAHLFPDPKEGSQLFSPGCIFCWAGSQKGLVRARACTSKWQQHMSGRGSKTSPFLAVVSC